MKKKFRLNAFITIFVAGTLLISGCAKKQGVILQDEGKVEKTFEISDVSNEKKNIYKDEIRYYISQIQANRFMDEKLHSICDAKAETTLYRIYSNIYIETYSGENSFSMYISDIKYNDNPVIEKSIHVGEDKSYVVYYVQYERSINGGAPEDIMLKFYFDYEDESNKIAYVNEYSNDFSEIDDATKENYHSEIRKLMNEYIMKDFNTETLDEDFVDEKTSQVNKDQEEYLKNNESDNNTEFEDNDLNTQIKGFEIVNLSIWNNLYNTYFGNKESVAIDKNKYGIENFACVDVLVKYSDDDKYDLFQDDEDKLSVIEFYLAKENGEWKVLDSTLNNSYSALEESKSKTFFVYNIDRFFSNEESLETCEKMETLTKKNEIKADIFKVNDCSNGLDVEILIKNNLNYTVFLKPESTLTITSENGETYNITLGDRDATKDEIKIASNNAAIVRIKRPDIKISNSKLTLSNSNFPYGFNFSNIATIK